MLPGNYTLTVYRGDTSRWTFTLWSDPEKTQAIDLGLAEIAAEIRAVGGTASSPVAALTCTVTPPNVILAVLPAHAALPPKGAPAEWDLQITWPSGDVQTVLSGGVEVLGDVTLRAVA